jgi:hypothetical protein
MVEEATADRLSRRRFLGLVLGPDQAVRRVMAFNVGKAVRRTSAPAAIVRLDCPAQGPQRSDVGGRSAPGGLKSPSDPSRATNSAACPYHVEVSAWH